MFFLILFIVVLYLEIKFHPRLDYDKGVLYFWFDTKDGRDFKILYYKPE